MASRTITSKGQVTVPKVIRDFLRLKPGDPIDFVIEDGGRVVVRPSTIDVRDLKGMLKRTGRRRVSLEEMEAAIARHHAKRR